MLVAEAAASAGASYRDLRVLEVTHAVPAERDGNHAPAHCRGLSLLVSAVLPFLVADPEMTALLDTLHGLGGDSVLVHALCTQVFGTRTGAAPQARLNRSHSPIEAADRPLLTRREIDILTEATSALSQEEIGERLGISARTVGTHFENIYRKLGVSRPLQAVMRAASLGYLQMGALEGPVAGTADENTSSLARILFRGSRTQDGAISGAATKQKAGQERLLADVGLLFLILSGAMAIAKQDEGERPRGHSMLLGHLTEGAHPAIGRFGDEFAVCPSAMVVAPPSAARAGFTPGGLYVADVQSRAEGLNSVRILEFTPAGKFVGCFTGSRELGFCMAGKPSLCFAEDGRLLVASTHLTEGILAFRNGGRVVERFASGLFDRIACDAAGVVYAASGNAMQVFTPAGRHVRTLVKWPEGAKCVGLVCDNTAAECSAGVRLHAVVQSPDGADGACLYTYDVRGQRVGTAPLPTGACSLAVDERGRCYVAEPAAGAIHVFENGRRAHPLLHLGAKHHPVEVAVGACGVVYVCGQTVDS